MEKAILKDQLKTARNLIKNMIGYSEALSYAQNVISQRARADVGSADNGKASA